MKSNVKSTFFNGVLILTVANLLTKVIGLVFKIPLTNMLDNEGMGYFNTAYQIYAWLYMLSTAGVPVALSMMISELDAKGQKKTKKKLFKITLALFSALGLIGSAVMFFCSKGIAGFISADKAYLCIMAISPALLFICITSTVRGYFQGHRNMLPTGISEIIEAILKLSIGISLGMYALSKGYELYVVAAYAILGVTVGTGAGAAYLVISAFFSKALSNKSEMPTTEEPESISKLAGTFLKIAVPVMLSSSLLSMSSMFDTLIVIRRLQDINISETAAIAAYGNYTAYCVTLFNLPPVLIYPIVNTLIPSLVSAKAQNDSKRITLLTEKNLKLTAMISLPCSLGLGVMSLPILKLIFSNEANAQMAAPLLSTLAPSVFLIGVMAVTNAMLQALKLQRYSLISMIAGVIIKGIGAFLLPALPIGQTYLGIYAAPISTFLFYFTITTFNFYFLLRHTDFRFSILRVFWRPLVAAVICSVTAAGIYTGATIWLGELKIMTLVAIGIAAIVYALTLLLLGAITKSDVALLPKIGNLIYKIPLVRSLVREDK